MPEIAFEANQPGAGDRLHLELAKLAREEQKKVDELNRAREATIEEHLAKLQTQFNAKNKDMNDADRQKFWSKVEGRVRNFRFVSNFDDFGNKFFDAHAAEYDALVNSMPEKDMSKIEVMYQEKYQ